MQLKDPIVLVQTVSGSHICASHSSVDYFSNMYLPFMSIVQLIPINPVPEQSQTLGPLQFPPFSQINTSQIGTLHCAPSQCVLVQSH